MFDSPQPKTSKHFKNKRINIDETPSRRQMSKLSKCSTYRQKVNQTEIRNLIIPTRVVEKKLSHASLSDMLDRVSNDGRSRSPEHRLNSGR